MVEFKKELENLINKHSIENECDIPDFLLAEMVCNLIKTIGETTKKNLDWHGCDRKDKEIKEQERIIYTMTHHNGDVEETALKIVNLIIDDIWDRSGIGDEWQGIDEDIQEEIKKEWCEIIMEGAKQ